MLKESAVQQQHDEEDVISDSKPVTPASAISRDTDKQTFSELSELYKDNQLQISKAKTNLKMLAGDHQNPGTLWKFIEFYGIALNPKDTQEHVLKFNDQTWSIRRTNNKYVWDVDGAVEVFRLAYVISTAEENSQKQIEAFDAFQCLLEKLVDAEVVLEGEAWWRIIDDAADLYRTTIVRTIRTGALESISDEIPELLIKALCRPVSPEYGLHVQYSNKKTATPVAAVACSGCDNVVDEEDFYCKYCGHPMGKE